MPPYEKPKVFCKAAFSYTKNISAPVAQKGEKMKKRKKLISLLLCFVLLVTNCLVSNAAYEDENNVRKISKKCIIGKILAYPLL
ncbi:MAG: hypothetical protein J6A50_00775 [Clostridia bacterium]|nr:hypothetical protein [Clostridia bacterium]